MPSSNSGKDLAQYMAPRKLLINVSYIYIYRVPLFK